MDTRAPRFTTHGCRLNIAETAAMEEMARRAGLSDAVILNSCAVTSEASAKARRELRRMRRENPGARIIVTGCAAQTEAARFAAMDEVDHVLGNDEKLRPDAWARLAAGQAAPVEAGDIMASRRAAPALARAGARTRAHLQIQNGCDHRCTFCIIPYGRGNSRSVPADQVLARARDLLAEGHREIVLTGVDLTSWGGDLDGGPRLGDLVQRLLAELSVPRLRLSSIDSVEADAALIEALGEPRLMPHLHLSLQHGDDLILKRMKRRHGRADAIRLCEAARARRPDIAFGADLIAGFPTESEAAFEASLSLIDACGLTWLHVFPFSPRPGTPAARMPQLAGPLIRERAARLRAAGAAARARFLSGEVGARREVLVESDGRGRTGQFAEVAFTGPAPAPGAILPVRVTGHDDRGLTAAIDEAAP